MDLILFISLVVAALALIIKLKSSRASVSVGMASQLEAQKDSSQYFYSRKNGIMTKYEWQFYERLTKISAGRYHVFPQIHLSAFMKNETRGKYNKLSFQRINRRSVDFVLCDIETGRVAYAVELDDNTHDLPSRQHRDSIVQEMLDQVNIPLVRFRDVNRLTDEDMINRFREYSK